MSRTRPILNVPPLPTLAERMLVRLADENLSYADLAYLIDSYPQTICRIVNRQTNPTIAYLWRVARELNTTVGYLVGETNEPRRLS